MLRSGQLLGRAGTSRTEHFAAVFQFTDCLPDAADNVDRQQDTRAVTIESLYWVVYMLSEGYTA